MSTLLTKEQKQQNLAAAVEAEAAAAAAVTAYEQKVPVPPFFAATNSQKIEDYRIKKDNYDVRLAQLNAQLADATMVKIHANYALRPPETNFGPPGYGGGKKSRKSQNSKKQRKSKKSHTTYKKSKRSRR